MKRLDFKRGHVYYADLGLGKGSEQGGLRPVLIIQNDIGNKYSPTVIALAMTSKVKKDMPTHVVLNKDKYDTLQENSIILAEQVKTLDKTRIVSKEPFLILESEDMKRVESTLKISMGICQ